MKSNELTMSTTKRKTVCIAAGAISSAVALVMMYFLFIPTTADRMDYLDFFRSADKTLSPLRYPAFAAVILLLSFGIALFFQSDKARHFSWAFPIVPTILSAAGVLNIYAMHSVSEEQFYSVVLSTQNDMLAVLLIGAAICVITKIVSMKKRKV